MFYSISLTIASSGKLTLDYSCTGRPVTVYANGNPLAGDSLVSESAYGQQMIHKLRVADDVSVTLYARARRFRFACSPRVLTYTIASAIPTPDECITMYNGIKQREILCNTQLHGIAKSGYESEIKVTVL